MHFILRNKRPENTGFLKNKPIPGKLHSVLYGGYAAGINRFYRNRQHVW
jgi:hypothetical protein